MPGLKIQWQACLVVAAVLPRCNAWWDEGHMLVVVVAKRYVQDVVMYDELLSKMPAEFSNFSNMVYGAVWPDHIRCNADDLQQDGANANGPCGGLERAVDLELFDALHFAEFAYNPDNITLPGLAEAIPISRDARGSSKWFPYATDAISALTLIDHSLRGTTRNGLSTTSPWSWSLQLLLALHILGDLHQPLHTTNLYTSDFPDGNDAGWKLKVLGLKWPVGNMHHLWDAGGGNYWTRVLPIPLKDLDSMASELIKRTGQPVSSKLADFRRSGTTRPQIGAFHQLLMWLSIGGTLRSKPSV